MTPDLRLAVPVAVAWAAVALLIGVPQALPWAALALWGAALAGIAIGRFTGHRAVVVLSLTLAVAALVVSVAAVRAPARQPADLVAAADAGRHATALVTANESVQPGSPFDATLTKITFGDESRAVSLPITVFPPAVDGRGGSGKTAGVGSTLALAGTLVTTDPADASAFRFFAGAPPKVLAPPPWSLDWANALRKGFAAAASTLPGDGGALLPGLAIGDTGAVSDALDSAMKGSSLSHLTAVSGANCAVIIALIMLAGARIGLSKWIRIAASTATLLGFVVLVTPQPSVLRAAVMAVIVLAAMLSGRPVSGLPVLALATVVLLLTDPWLSRSYGFVLSVLATGGLLVLARPLALRLGRWMPGWLAVIIAIPLAAQLACQPVLLLLNPTIATYGVFANLLAEPAAPVATVLGLLACILLPLIPGLGTLFASLAWLPSAWIAGVATFFVSLPGSSLPWPGGMTGVALCVAVIAFALLLALGVGGTRTRVVSAGFLALTLVGFVGVTAGGEIRGRLSRPADWQIAACDIGQGDAVLVRSLGVAALIDTGPDPKLLASCLDTLGISRIDLLILSHYDLDHVGGVPAVIGMVTRAMIGPTSDSNDRRLHSRLAAGGAQITQVSQGLSGMLGELRWEVLWPKEPLAGVQPGNDASVTVRFSGAGECAGGCLSSIFLGDLGEEPQGRLLAANPGISEVDVVKVAHHGSADQNERLYQRLTASVGLISVGLGNSYGHPTSRLLKILQRSGTLAMRTDQEGLLLVSPRPEGGATVWSEHSMAAGKLTGH